MGRSAAIRQLKRMLKTPQAHCDPLYIMQAIAGRFLQIFNIMTNAQCESSHIENVMTWGLPKLQKHTSSSHLCHIFVTSLSHLCHISVTSSGMWSCVTRGGIDLRVACSSAAPEKENRTTAGQQQTFLPLKMYIPL